MPRPKLRTSSLRDRVLDVAMRRFSEDGPHALTARGVAEQANTSPAAIYELFGDKSGLLRALFYEGFRRLNERFSQIEESDDPLADLVGLFGVFRDFVKDNRELSNLMFSRPFADFEPGDEERESGNAAREAVVRRSRRCIEAGLLDGDPTDISHVLLAVAQGLATQESAGWLGTTRASIERRWRLAFDMLLRPRRDPGQLEA